MEGSTKIKSVAEILEAWNNNITAQQKELNILMKEGKQIMDDITRHIRELATESRAVEMNMKRKKDILRKPV